MGSAVSTEVESLVSAPLAVNENRKKFCIFYSAGSLNHKDINIFFLSFSSLVRSKILNRCHGGRAGERRVRSCRSGQCGLAETLHGFGDAAAEVSATGRENQRAAGREGKRAKHHGSQRLHSFTNRSAVEISCWAIEHFLFCNDDVTQDFKNKSIFALSLQGLVPR